MKPKIEKVSALTEREVIQFLTVTTLNEPPNRLLFPDPVKRIFNTAKISATFTRMLGIFDERYFVRIGNKIVAAGMWIPSGRQITNNHLIRFGFLAIPLLMGFRTFRIVMRFLDISTKIREDQMGDRNHWYLFYLATDPGIKSSVYTDLILNHLITKSEKKNEPVFMHCFEKEKLPFLEKRGFKTVSAIKFSQDCIMHCLIREPKKKLKKGKGL